MVGGAYAPRHRWRRSIARLPSYSQGYCSTYERPGTWRSLLGTSPAPQTLAAGVDARGGVGGFRGRSCERISGPGALRGRRRGSAAPKTGPPPGAQNPLRASGLQGGFRASSKAGKPSENRLQGFPGLQEFPSGASGACRSLSPLSSSQDFQRTQMKRCCC